MIAPTELISASFHSRSNRFVALCSIPGRGRVRAFMPNPGRMWELLFPGVTLLLTEVPANQHRLTRFTVVAIERGGETILLDTHRTNTVAHHLLTSQRVPGLESWSVADAEVSVGSSRFDFRLTRGGQQLLLEVKSCTLFGNGVAMFPDAVTERGRRHLLELAHLTKTTGHRAAVLFVVHSMRPRWFMPDFHSDLEFSRTLLQVRRQVLILPVAVRWNSDLTLRPGSHLLDIPWSYLEREVDDRGAYLLLLRLRRRRKIEVGALGRIRFAPGWYVYVGSAMKALDARLERHVRLRKNMRWHVDYLRQVADEVVPLPIRSSRRLECELAEAVAAHSQQTIDGFGSSDCGCQSHLFQLGRAPLHDPNFHELLQRYRMAPPS
ncbi:MAG: DNA/RNA nuclease SfsA [Candidatus Latescibacterota bacterium]|nr:DNA/RNA nuclease SfsA [Candidatus Latescibacterota bacterium]